MSCGRHRERRALAHPRERRRTHDRRDRDPPGSNGFAIAPSNTVANRALLWINPHTWIHLEVTNPDGTTTDWALEGGGINALTQRGWQRDDIQAGDTISVRCHRLRDGAQGCLLGYIKTEDGVEKEWD